ncbi:hypothetical protein ACGFZP_37675 [Kitasatospora sp. NPDC048239]|uniref:hypothetical protein n=1 Tax=Kitasatospora sp. NPDC048239 TaxID=3364046 RepID=UPI003717FC02
MKATEQPSYLFLTALARIHQGLSEILEDIQALRRAGRRKDLDRFAAVARPAFDRLLEHLEDIRADLSD